MVNKKLLVAQFVEIIRLITKISDLSSYNFYVVIIKIYVIIIIFRFVKKSESYLSKNSLK